MFENLLVKIANVLDKAQIPYMIIGGQAVLLYGVPRLTEDIDITLGIGVEERKIVKKLFGKISLVIPRSINDEFIKKTNVLIGIERKTGIRVDFIFSYSPYEMEALKRTKQQNIKGYKVKFASIEDVIIHKIFASRARDLEDAKIIIKKQYKKIDFKYITKWLKEFSVLPERKDILTVFKRLYS